MSTVPKVKIAKKVADSTKPKETKAAKFTRLAQARVSKAIKGINNIGNLGGPSYESTAEQREKIETALRSALDLAISRLFKQETKISKFSL